MCSPTRIGGTPAKYWMNPMAPCATSRMSSIHTARAHRRDGGAKRARTANATLSPSSTITASACNCVTCWGSKPIRRATPSSLVAPACGPLPVTTTPSTSVMPAAIAVSQASARRIIATGPTASAAARAAGAGGADAGGADGATRGSGGHSCSSTVAMAMRTMDSSRCPPTSQGFRSERTVNPPSTAWAGMPRKIAKASFQRRPPRPSAARRCRTATTRVAIATTTRTQVSIRLANSICP